MAVLDVSVLHGESCWGPLQGRSLRTRGVPTAWLILAALALLSCSETSPLHSFLGGVRLKDVLYVVPQKAGGGDYSAIPLSL